MNKWNILLLSLVILNLVVALYLYTRVQGLDTQVRHTERKFMRIQTHLGIEPETSIGLSERVKELAQDPRGKIRAIKAYRMETGASLADAKQAVEDYIATLDR